MEKIVLEQISNPGISFTEDVNDKLLSLFDYIMKDQNKRCTYQQFQEELINNNIFTGSYIRSFIPFLFNSGIVNDYNAWISYRNFFTKNGLLYINVIRSLKNNADIDFDLSGLKTIKSDLLCMALDYMVKNNYKFYSKYLDILRFVKKYKTINREEFYLMEYCIQNNWNYDSYIESYRNHNIQFDIFIKSNNGDILSYRSNNAFNYLVAFLSEEQCNYLTKLNQSDYNINKKREKFIDLILSVEKEGE